MKETSYYIEKAEKLKKDLRNYSSRINIELQPGNDVTKAFAVFWDFLTMYNLHEINFTCNGVKITIKS